MRPIRQIHQSITYLLRHDNANKFGVIFFGLPADQSFLITGLHAERAAEFQIIFCVELPDQQSQRVLGARHRVYTVRETV